MLIFYTNSQTFRSLAVDFCMKKELRTNYLVRQPHFSVRWSLFTAPFWHKIYD